MAGSPDKSSQDKQSATESRAHQVSDKQAMDGGKSVKSQRTDPDKVKNYVNHLVDVIGNGHGFQKHVIDEKMYEKQDKAKLTTQGNAKSIDEKDSLRDRYKKDIRTTLESPNTYFFQNGPQISFYYNKDTNLIVVDNQKAGRKSAVNEAGTAYIPNSADGKSGFDAFAGKYVNARTKQVPRDSQPFPTNTTLQPEHLKGAKWPVGGAAERFEAYSDRPVPRAVGPGDKEGPSEGYAAAAKQRTARPGSPLLAREVPPNPSMSKSDNRNESDFSTSTSFSQAGSAQFATLGSRSYGKSGNSYVGQFQNYGQANPVERRFEQPYSRRDNYSEVSIQGYYGQKGSGKSFNVTPDRNFEPNYRAPVDGRGPAAVVNNSSGSFRERDQDRRGNDQNSWRGPQSDGPNAARYATPNRRQPDDYRFQDQRYGGGQDADRYGTPYVQAVRTVSYSSSDRSRDSQQNKRPFDEYSASSGQNNQEYGSRKRPAVPDFNRSDAGQSAYGHGGGGNQPREQRFDRPQMDHGNRQGERDRSGYRGR